MKEGKQPHKTWVLNNGNKPLDLWSLPQCTAKARSTKNQCKNRAMKNKQVCYLHGGKSPGAPKGNINALKHGAYTKDVMSEQSLIKEFIDDALSVVQGMKTRS